MYKGIYKEDEEKEKKGWYLDVRNFGSYFLACAVDMNGVKIKCGNLARIFLKDNRIVIERYGGVNSKLELDLDLNKDGRVVINVVE